MKLKTYKGSTIQRSKYGVGKLIVGQVYVHKLYMSEVIPHEILSKALDKLNVFEFNTVMWDEPKKIIRFDSAKNFDTAREPSAGKYVRVNYDTGKVTKGTTHFIWHHKWIWVKDSYKGFDVQESFEWSKEWLSKIKTMAKWTPKQWKKQLAKVGLK